MRVHRAPPRLILLAAAISALPVKSSGNAQATTNVDIEPHPDVAAVADAAAPGDSASASEPAVEDALVAEQEPGGQKPPSEEEGGGNEKNGDEARADSAARHAVMELAAYPADVVAAAEVRNGASESSGEGGDAAATDTAAVSATAATIAQEEVKEEKGKGKKHKRKKHFDGDAGATADENTKLVLEVAMVNSEPANSREGIEKEGDADAKQNVSASPPQESVANPQSGEKLALPETVTLPREKRNGLRKRARKSSSNRLDVSGETPTKKGNDAAEGASMAGALLDRDASDRQQVVAGGSWSESSEANCEVIGPCLMCAEDELKVTFCQKTGRREEVRCPMLGNMSGFSGAGAGELEGMEHVRSTATFRACIRTEQEEVTHFAHFWLSMLVLGMVSCVGMRRRQQKSLTLYDRRAK